MHPLHVRCNEAEVKYMPTYYLRLVRMWNALGFYYEDRVTCDTSPTRKDTMDSVSCDDYQIPRFLGN